MNQWDDMIIKLYELNERYHDTKEKMAWLASSLYFAFSFTIILTLLRSIKNIKHDFTEYLHCKWISLYNSLLVIIFLSLIFISALLFINFQFKKKRNSVKYTGELEKQLCSLQSKGEDKSESENRLSQLFKCRDEIFQDKIVFPDRYIYILMILFFAAQIILILYKCFI